MKKLTTMVLSLALILWFSGVARAEDKIGYVDLSRIFDEYSKTKEYDVVLEQEHNKYQEERNQRLNKLRDAQAKLALLKEEEKAKLQSEIDKDKADLLEFDRLKQTELRKQRDEKIREILLEIEKVVSDFAQKEKYKLILNDRVLVYGFPEWDLTEKVIKLLNQSYQKK